jgi:hypothetical protein
MDHQIKQTLFIKPAMGYSQVTYCFRVSQTKFCAHIFFPPFNLMTYTTYPSQEKQTAKYNEA